jgi:hypothetical protein
MSLLIVTEPVVQPVPLQPAKVDPAAALAVKMTTVPLLKVPEQVLPQFMPIGELVTVPVPVPALTSERVKLSAGWRSKVAIQDLLALIVTEPSVQSASPLQPANTEPAAGVAISVTEAPLA